MRPAALACVLSVVLTLVACRRTTPFVLVRVSAAESLPALAQLHVMSALPDRSAITDVPAVPRPLTLPTTFVLQLPDVARGSVSLNIEARNAAGQVVGTGEAEVKIAGGGDFIVSIVLKAAVVPPPVTKLSLSLLAGALGGPGNLDGALLAARFYEPYAVAVVGPNRLVVTEVGNAVLRLVDLAHGQVSILAGGTRLGGYSDGVGGAARFAAPADLVFDGASSVLVADGPRIRSVRVDTGEVTTLVGADSGMVDGSFTSARFGGLSGIARDPAGTLYVSDAINLTIRKVDLATHQVTTVAGIAGSAGPDDGPARMARFGLPNGLELADPTTLLITDTNGQTIRKLDLAAQTVTTLVGSYQQVGDLDGPGAAARLRYPNKIAVDIAGGFAYVTQMNTVRRFGLRAPYMVTTQAGAAGLAGNDDGSGGGARLDAPYGVSFDGSGHLFVVDLHDSNLREIDLSSGSVTTVAGSSAFTRGAFDGPGLSARFFGPWGMDADGAGNLIVAELFNCTIRSIGIATGEVTTLAGVAESGGFRDGVGSAALFANPAGLTVDGGEVYIADLNNSRIRRLTLATREVTTVAGGLAGFADGTFGQALFNGPRGVSSDGAGNLFVADTGNQVIRQLTLRNQTVTTIAGAAGVGDLIDGSAAASRFRNPFDLAADGMGHVYVLDSGNKRVRKIDLAARTVSSLAGLETHLLSPLGLRLDRTANRLLIGDSGASTIVAVDLSSGTATTFAGMPRRAGVMLGELPAGLNGPIGMALIPGAEGGGLAIADFVENAILLAH